MDILFIDPNSKPGLNQEVNGTLILGSLLSSAGFDVDVLRFHEIEGYKEDYPKFIRNIVDKICVMNPSAISFYSLWPDYHITLRIASLVKERNSSIYVILGGPHPSVCARETLTFAPYIDCIASGEGECTVIPLFNSLLRDQGHLDNIPGLYYRVGSDVRFNNIPNPVFDINLLPYWDEKLYFTRLPDETYASRSYFMPIDVGRGCPFSCTYCTSSTFWKRNYRLKSPDRIIEEIIYFRKKYGIRSFRFSHDAFTVNKNLVSEICDRIINEKLDIVWVCTSRIDCITEDLILKMKLAGMIRIELGVESGSARIQKLINKKLNLTRVRHVVKFLLSEGIDVVLFFMFGFPQEEEDDLSDTLALQLDLLDMGVSRESMALCRFAPGTKLTEEYFESLVFDPSVMELREHVFGYEEEKAMICSNKKIFSMFYHLNSYVRDNYQNLRYFMQLYQKFPNSIRYLRTLYGGNDLQFYRDFCSTNQIVLDQGVEHLGTILEEAPLELVYRMIDNISNPSVSRLKELFRYDRNIQLVSRSRESKEITDEYGFNYIDLKYKLRLSEFTSGRSVISMKKINGKTEVRLVKIIPV